MYKYDYIITRPVCYVSVTAALSLGFWVIWINLKRWPVCSIKQTNKQYKGKEWGDKSHWKSKALPLLCHLAQLLISSSVVLWEGNIKSAPMRPRLTAVSEHRGWIQKSHSNFHNLHKEIRATTPGPCCTDEFWTFDKFLLTLGTKKSRL